MMARFASALMVSMASACSELLAGPPPPSAKAALLSSSPAGTWDAMAEVGVFTPFG